MKKLLPILLVSLVVLWACDNDEKIFLSDSVREFIENKYNGSRILSAEQDLNGDIDVEIVHNGTLKEVKFNRNNIWIATIWDIAKNKLPDAIKETIAERYPEYRIDDIDYVEKPLGEYYKIEIEKGEWDKTIYVTLYGDILN